MKLEVKNLKKSFGEKEVSWNIFFDRKWQSIGTSGKKWGRQDNDDPYSYGCV